MSAEELTRLAISHYGISWKASLARDCGVYWTTVHGWSTGRIKIPPLRENQIKSILGAS